MIAHLVERLRAAGCAFAEDEARLLAATAANRNDLMAMVDRRVGGEPLEYVLGWVEFCGRRISVDPGVFVPRRRTEFLVQQAVEFAPSRAVVVDLCCGCGAVGAALALAVDQVKLYAVDIDPVAVRCARRNLSAVRGRVVEGDLYDPLPLSLRGGVNILVANAPYVPTDDFRFLPPEARLHEPRVALDGGPDGLDVVRRLSAGASAWLTWDGHLLVETSKRQVPRVMELFATHGLSPRVATSADVEATVVVGSRRG